jgi:hypothetical protein
VENTYTSSNPSTWTVTAASSGVAGSTKLTVNGPQYSPWDLNHDGKIDFQDLVIFLQAYINYGEYGIYNAACDFSHCGAINFQDLVMFLTAYINYGEYGIYN